MEAGVFNSTITSQVDAGKVQISLVGGLHGDLAPHAELVATSVTACRAAIVARALVWHRAIGDLGPDHPFADAARATLATFGDPSPFAAV